MRDYFSTKHKEAEAVYRQDLQEYPHNGWSLFGLTQSLKAQGKLDEATPLETEFKKAWSQADIELKMSQLSD